MRRWRSLLFGGVLIGLSAGIAAAQTTNFSVPLGPDKPGVNSGKGTATLVLDGASKTLNYTIEYSGLSAPPAVAAFLSPPATQNGQPGTVPINLPADAASPIKGSMKLTDAQIAGLKSGKWLLLIGTQQAPEIGGEVKPKR